MGSIKRKEFSFSGIAEGSQVSVRKYLWGREWMLKSDGPMLESVGGLFENITQTLITVSIGIHYIKGSSNHHCNYYYYLEELRHNSGTVFDPQTCIFLNSTYTSTYLLNE